MPSTASTSTPIVVPDFLRLAGHPVRWQLLTELARSDRLVRELAAVVGERQSLTSYHLGQLRGGGLVTVRRSSADGRDSYYSLDLAGCRDLLVEAGAALHPGLRLAPAAAATAIARRRRPSQPARVLFLCTGNSSRSQMAEALLQRRGGARVDVVSAGSHPKPVHPSAIRVMRERGIDISRRRSKPLDEFAEHPFDRVISLCDRVREVCPAFPGRPVVAHWSIPEPAAQAAASDDGDTAFDRCADELSIRIDFLQSVLDQDLTTSKETRHAR